MGRVYYLTHIVSVIRSFTSTTLLASSFLQMTTVGEAVANVQHSVY